MSTISCRLALIACLVVPAGFVAAPAFAAAAPSAQAESQAGAEQAEAQRKLTEKDLAAFLTASRSIEPLLAALPEDKRGDPDAASLAGLEKAAKAAGLKDYADYDEIAANVAFVLQGFDPATKSYVGAKAIIESEIARVKADKKMSKRDRSDALSELNQALENIDEVQYPDNIALVAKHYDELGAFQQP